MTTAVDADRTRGTLVGLSATDRADNGTRHWLDASAGTGRPHRGHARLDHVYLGAAGEGAQGG